MLTWVQHCKDAKASKTGDSIVKNFTTYGLAVGAALAASLAFSELASADMMQNATCNPAYGVSVCNAQSGQSDHGPTGSQLSRTNKNDSANRGGFIGTDRRQAKNPSSAIDRRQEAGSRSSIGHGGNSRGGGNRGSGRR
jgi:hypothetical protein